MARSINQRVRDYRMRLRRAGLRPVQLWVPDTRSPEFGKECRRQCRVVAKAEVADRGLDAFLDGALDELAQLDDAAS